VDGDTLPWHIDVDPLNPRCPLIPDDFIDLGEAREAASGCASTRTSSRKLRSSLAAWMLSQFLHGEQGALFAAAQVTEAVQFFDGKLYGSDAGDGRGPPRRGLPSVPRREAQQALSDQRQPLS
jgi:hypothetical protein